MSTALVQLPPAPGGDQFARISLGSVLSGSAVSRFRFPHPSWNKIPWFSDVLGRFNLPPKHSSAEASSCCSESCNSSGICGIRSSPTTALGSCWEERKLGKHKFTECPRSGDRWMSWEWLRASSIPNSCPGCCRPSPGEPFHGKKCRDQGFLLLFQARNVPS